MLARLTGNLLRRTSGAPPPMAAPAPQNGDKGGREAGDDTLSALLVGGVPKDYTEALLKPLFDQVRPPTRNR